MMLLFDPTINWSRELLEPPIPDLLVVQSEAPSNTNSPWHPSSGEASWNSVWVEYAAVDRNEHHLTFTFFDIKSASKEEKLRIAEYTEKSDEVERAIGWYRSKSSIDNFVEALSKTNTIRCYKRAVTFDKKADESSNPVVVFQKMTQPSTKRSLAPDWSYLMIEPLEDVPPAAFLAPHGWETEFEQVAESSQGNRQSGEPSSQVEALTLYMVASNKKPTAVEATSENPQDESKTAT